MTTTSVLPITRKDCGRCGGRVFPEENDLVCVNCGFRRCEVEGRGYLEPEILPLEALRREADLPRPRVWHRGRRRMYQSDADRQAAYRERVKARA